MNRLVDLDFELWFLNKNHALCSASVNSSYTYEVIAETEKAICIKIDSKERKNKPEWKQWIPKSAIC